MPRPKRKRAMVEPPIMSGFTPVGLPFEVNESVVLLFEEWECLRLLDYNGLTQDEASKIMNISRPTFTRIYENSRKVIAKAFVEGKSLEIKGGNVFFETKWFRCEQCSKTFNANSVELLKCDFCDSNELTNINDKVYVQERISKRRPKEKKEKIAKD